jgi:hypothetical protein
VHAAIKQIAKLGPRRVRSPTLCAGGFMKLVRTIYGVLLILVAGCSAKASHHGNLDGGFFGNPSGSGGSGAHGNGQDGGLSAAPTMGAGSDCQNPGETQSCCGSGTRVCRGQVEFATWGPCIDSKGDELKCLPTDKCGQGEFAKGCDAGSPPEPPGPPPEPPALCHDETVSNEPEILAAYAPADGESVSEDGQIKVWVNDEHPATIAPNEQVDATTGAVTTPGDRSAKAPDGYLWEPALYIAPDSAEKGGTPHFPQTIKGWYNNVPPTNGRPPRGAGTEVPNMDPPPSGTKLHDDYTTEFIWNVKDLNLAPGTYIAEFVIHDGDRDRAVGCVTIVVTK